MKKQFKIALGILALLVILVPLGLLSDAPAWGEWDNEYYKKILGFVPEGMEKFNSFIKPILPDYSIPGKNDVLGYYVSAIAGVVIIFGVWFILGKILKRKSNEA